VLISRNSTLIDCGKSVDISVGNRDVTEVLGTNGQPKATKNSPLTVTARHAMTSYGLSYITIQIDADGSTAETSIPDTLHDKPKVQLSRSGTFVDRLENDLFQPIE
jgi:hypothetical protein